jgi:hypothetical protein
MRICQSARLLQDANGDALEVSALRAQGYGQLVFLKLLCSSYIYLIMAGWLNI